MSLHKFAEQVAAHGRGDDSLLVHMTPDEVQRLQAFAEANGTTMTINPDTGLPEAGFLSDLFKAVAPIALGAFLGPGAFGIAGMGLSAGTAGLVTGGLTTLATGSLSRGLMAGLGAYGGAGLAEGLMGAGVGAAQQSAMGSLSADQIASEMANTELTKQGVLNQAAADATKSAMANTGQAVSSGFNAVTANPSAMGQFAKDNFKYLGMAAAPIMADMMVPTTTKVPELKNNASVRQYIRNEDGTLTAMNPVPAAGYGTPAFKPFNEGGIVALNNGGVPSYAGTTGSVVGGGGLENIYRNLGGEDVYKKIADDYLKATGGNTAGLAAIMSKYDTPVAAPAAVTPAAAPAAVAPIVAAPAAATVTPQQQAAMNLMFKSLTGGVDTAAMDAMGGAAAVRKLATAGGFNESATGLYDYAAKTPGAIDWKSKAGEQLASNYITARDANAFTSKFKTPAEQALELMYRSTTTGAPTGAFESLGGAAAVRKLAESAGFDATPEWQAEYEKKMGYKVIPRMSTAETIAADKAASAAATSGLATLPRVDAGADTKLDFTGDGTSTVKPVAVKSTGTYNTVAGNTYVPPPIGTAVGQGTYQGQGTMASSGTQGPIVDFKGKSAFTTDPVTLAKQQIADKAAAKTAADATKLDLYRQFGIQNPTATKLDHANFIDKIGLAPETAAQLLNISPDQAKDMYYDAKFNKQTGDSKAAYDYLMGKGVYPTKSGVGEIMRPYGEATLGMPANTNRQYIYDQTTGKYSRNPDYVAEYKDPSGGTNYLLSQKEIFDYFKKNASQDDATTYAWALANNVTPKEISEATGVPISQIAPKWRAAASKQAADKAATEVKNEDGTINKEATDQKIAEKAAADKVAADAAADKAVKDNWDEAAYLAANPDVAAELASGKSVSGQPVKFKSGYEHYTMFGKDSGRQATTKKASGGLMKLAMGGMPIDGYAAGGGLGSLGSYSDGGRLLRGPGDGVSDSIPATIGRKQQPARLADGEFVVPARIVSELGNGSTEAGAKKLYAMMDRVQRARGATTGKNKVAANSRADKYLPA